MTSESPSSAPIEDEPKKPGHIDIVRLFAAEALELFTSVEQGRLLHGTRNIRDSGAPLEARLREFLAARIPSQFRVMQGYLFDVDSNCTPQIDAMLLSAQDCHALMMSQEGVAYLPFTSALAVIEIKNSVRAVKKQLDQLAALQLSIEGMKAALRSRRTGGATLPELITVMFFADSVGSKLSDFKE